MRDPLLNGPSESDEDAQMRHALIDTLGVLKPAALGLGFASQRLTEAGLEELADEAGALEEQADALRAKVLAEREERGL